MAADQYDGFYFQWMSTEEYPPTCREVWDAATKAAEARRASANSAINEICSFVKAMKGARSAIVRDQVIDLWLTKWSELRQ